MRTRFLLLIFLTGIVAGLIFWRTGNESPLVLPEYYTLPIEEEKSLEGFEENPQARLEFMNKMLSSPRSGGIPNNIRNRELLFSEQMEINSIRPGARLSAIDNWTSRGPINVGGRTRGAAINATDEDVIVAGGVSGGIWRTQNSGDDWQNNTDPSSLHSVSALVQDQRAGKNNIWYYGTGELRGNSASNRAAPFRGDGIFKSTDNGVSWNKLPATSTDNPAVFDNQFNYVWNIALDQNDPNNDVVFAAIFGGIARSTDGGNSWDIVLGSDFGFNGDINNQVGSFYTDVAVTPDGVVYAVLSEQTNNPVIGSIFQGVYRSTDQGDSWENITPNTWPNEYSRVVIGIAPQNPRIIYFLLERDNGAGLWHLADVPFLGITDWQDRSFNIPNFGPPVGDFDTQGSYNMTVAVHPEELNTVFIGGTNLYRSTDGFTSTQNVKWIGGYDPINDISIYAGSHPDQHSLHFYESNPNRALSSHDGGLSITENILADSVIWRKVNTGYVTSQFYTITMDESGTNDILFGGMQDNGTYITISDNEQVPWSRLFGGDGAFAAISRDALFYYVSTSSTRIIRLTFNESFENTSFARVDPIGAGETTGQEYLFINPYILDPNNSNIMYLAGGDRIWRNLNLSQIPSGSNEPTLVNWSSLDETRITAGQISALDASHSPRDVVYYGSSERRLLRIDDAASGLPTVTDITDFAQFPVGGYVSSISVDPLDANKVLVAFSNYEVLSLFYSEDAGETFTSVGGNLEENPDGSGNGPSVRWVEVIPLENDEILYLAGTSTGLYSASELDGENTVWTKESPDEIGNKVVSMIQYRSTDGKVIVSTHGNGVYEAIIPNTEPIIRDDGDLRLAVGTPYPNPFQDQVNIPFSIPENEIIKVDIINMLGQPVRTLFFGTQLSGNNTLGWDGTNNSGVPVPDGVYVCAIQYRDKSVGARVILSRTQ